MRTTKIEWTQRTWNPCVGCSRISPGCQHCYAELMSVRLAGMARNESSSNRRHHYLNVIEGGRWNRNVEPVPEALEEPLAWKNPATIFVNSMSDLFHEKLPFGFISSVFDVMQRASWHTFQILTKRAERLAEMASRRRWPGNVWMGVSVESDDYLERIDHLRTVPAAVRFVSLEPLLGPMPRLDLTGIDWVIVGGESGPSARPMRVNWVREIRDRCRQAEVPFFFKQWGTHKSNPDPFDPTDKKNGGHAKGGRMLDSRLWDQMPVIQTVPRLDNDSLHSSRRQMPPPLPKPPVESTTVQRTKPNRNEPPDSFVEALPERSTPSDDA